LPTLKIFGKARPRNPSNGCVSSFLVLLAMIGIIVILTSIKCHHILNSEPSAASEGATNCISLPSKEDDNFNCQSMHYEGDYSFHSEGVYDHNLQHSLDLLSGYTTSFADADSERIKTQIYFDTDSIFFVCNDSTTGHICNDIRNFIPGFLWQSNKSLTTANGTRPCLQEGTVRLQLIDDNGIKQTFILDNCLFHPNLLVNLLSTRRLAEKFIDSNRNPDKRTRIKSRYSTHVLTWSFGDFRKTFPTTISGLPELLFDEGFHKYCSFCMQVSSFATTNEVQGGSSNTIPFDDDEV
jgi:hypothetical protein